MQLISLASEQGIVLRTSDLKRHRTPAASQRKTWERFGHSNLGVPIIWVVGSLGGMIAHRMASQMEHSGERVAPVAHLDSRPESHEGQHLYARQMQEDEAALLLLFARHLQHLGREENITFPCYAEFRACEKSKRREMLLSAAVETGAMSFALASSFVPQFLEHFLQSLRLVSHNRAAIPRIQAPAVLFRASTISKPYEGFVPLEEPVGTTNDDSITGVSITNTCRSSPGTHESFVFYPFVYVKMLVAAGVELNQVVDGMRFVQIVDKRMKSNLVDSLPLAFQTLTIRSVHLKRLR